MSVEVLILSGLYDFATDLVALQLRELGVPFLRLNREQLPQLRCSLDPLAGTLWVRSDDHAWEVSPNVRSIWYRQPVFLRESATAPTDLNEQLERSQWIAFVRAMTVFRGAAWMNDPVKTYQAEIKPYQLATAKRVGLRVPDTLIGNDAGAFGQLGQSIALKSLDGVLLSEGDDSLFAYTTILDQSSIVEASIHRAPVIAQRLLTGKVDIRVTVIGTEIFAVRILRDKRGIDGDWRRVPKAELHYESCDLPQEVEAACRRLLLDLGLTFGGVDLIETSDGIFFIEINPTGEWAWLVSPSRPLDRVIAHWLASAERPS